MQTEFSDDFFAGLLRVKTVLKVMGFFVWKITQNAMS